MAVRIAVSRTGQVVISRRDSFFISLNDNCQPITKPSLIPRALAQQLGYSTPSHSDPLGTLCYADRQGSMQIPTHDPSTYVAYC